MNERYWFNRILQISPDATLLLLRNKSKSEKLFPPKI